MTQTGVYFGGNLNTLSSQLAAYTKWLGAAPSNVLTYLNDDSWSGFDSSIPYAAKIVKGAAASAIWSVPLTVTGTSLEQVATGAYNAHFLKAAQSLAQMKPSADGNIYIRVGWEFNGDWMPWSAVGHENAFVKSYQQFVTTFRSVSSKFKFVWDVNEGDSKYDPTKAYPGDKYVDVVGMDSYYNPQYDSTNPAAAFQHNVNETYGLQWQQNFAAAHGKKTAISEWGVRTENAGAYVDGMTKWLKDHNMVYENYWDSYNAGYSGKLSDGHNPNTGAAYKAAIKGLAGGATPSAGAGTHTGTSVKLALNDTADHVVNQAEAKAVAFVVSGLAAGTKSAAEFSDGTHTKIVTVSGNGSFKTDLTGFNGKVTSSLTTTDAHGKETSVTGNAGVFDTSADTASAARLLVQDTADHVIAPSEAKAVRYTMSGLDGDADAVATFRDGVHTKSVAIASNGTFTTDLSGFSGTVTSTVTVTDAHANTAVVQGNTVKVGQPAFSQDDTLHLRVSGDSFRGDPHFTVSVDGKQIGGTLSTDAAHASGAYQDIALNGAFGAGDHLVTVKFLDDAYAAGQGDRNLYVHQLNFAGKTYAGDASVHGIDPGSDGVANFFHTGSADWHI